MEKLENQGRKSEAEGNVEPHRLPLGQGKEKGEDVDQYTIDKRNARGNGFRGSSYSQFR